MTEGLCAYVTPLHHKWLLSESYRWR